MALTKRGLQQTMSTARVHVADPRLAELPRPVREAFDGARS